MYIETYKDKPIDAKSCANIMQALLNKGIAWEDVKVTRHKNAFQEESFTIFYIEDFQQNQDKN